ncbi:MAG: protein kinase [bacterium]|nr:protein kinase [bacterium]
MINPNKLCPGCMTELKDGIKYCPHCGYDIYHIEVSPRCLPPYTILAGKYLIGKVLGEGGFGITYIGWDLNLEMKVAIKEYFPTGLATRDTTHTDMTQLQILPGNAKTYYDKGLSKYTEEAKLLSRFSQEEGIVSVKDYIYENGTAYIVMEYIEGRSLKEEMAIIKKPYTEQQMFLRIMPILHSLERVHATGVLHRDISPDNIMVTMSGQVRLIDFGSARVATGDDNKSLTIMLKHGYAPEEQYRTKGNQGPWTDIYSLCATMYRMLTGVVPDNAMDRLYRDTLKPIYQFQNNCSPEVAAVIMKGLSVRAADRYQSVREFRVALEQARNSSQLISSNTKHMESAALSGKQTQTLQQSSIKGNQAPRVVQPAMQNKPDVRPQPHISQESRGIVDTVNPVKTTGFKEIKIVLLVCVVMLLILAGVSAFADWFVEEYSVVDFSDAIVEKSVKEVLGKDSSYHVRYTEMEKITELDCSGCSSLKDVQYCTNMRRLTAANGTFEVLGNLYGLDHLEYLNISEGCVKNIEGLKGKNYLKEVDLSNNPITDLTVLNTLPSLEVVSIIDLPDVGIEYYDLPNIDYVYTGIFSFEAPTSYMVYERPDLNSSLVRTIGPDTIEMKCRLLVDGNVLNWICAEFIDEGQTYRGFIYMGK